MQCVNNAHFVTLPFVTWFPRVCFHAAEELTEFKFSLVNRTVSPSAHLLQSHLTQILLMSTWTAAARSWTTTTTALCISNRTVWLLGRTNSLHSQILRFMAAGITQLLQALVCINDLAKTEFSNIERSMFLNTLISIPANFADSFSPD